MDELCNPSLSVHLHADGCAQISAISVRPPPRSIALLPWVGAAPCCIVGRTPCGVGQANTPSRLLLLGGRLSRLGPTICRPQGQSTRPKASSPGQGSGRWAIKGRRHAHTRHSRSYSGPRHRACACRRSALEQAPASTGVSAHPSPSVATPARNTSPSPR
jgi:hypothetical protein